MKKMQSKTRTCFRNYCSPRIDAHGVAIRGSLGIVAADLRSGDDITLRCETL